MSMFAVDFNPKRPIAQVFMVQEEIKAITPSGDLLDFGLAPAIALESIHNGRAILVEFNDLGPVAEHVIHPQVA